MPRLRRDVRIESDLAEQVFVVVHDGRAALEGDAPDHAEFIQRVEHESGEEIGDGFLSAFGLLDEVGQGDDEVVLDQREQVDGEEDRHIRPGAAAADLSLNRLVDFVVAARVNRVDFDIWVGGVELSGIFIDDLRDRTADRRRVVEIDLHHALRLCAQIRRAQRKHRDDGHQDDQTLGHTHPPELNSASHNFIGMS